MHNDVWTKITKFNFLGKYTLFTKEEICTEINYEGEIYKINVTPEYYNSEFKINDEKKKE